jgi:enoyl-CoA hydratase/carnithine racemase
MNALLKKAMPMYMVEYLEYTGARLTAAQCVQHHIVQKACPMETLSADTMEFALAINKRRGVAAEMKKRLNQDIVQALDVDDVAYIEAGQFNIG